MVLSLVPIAWAILPDTPASISSNTMVATGSTWVNTAFIANRNRLISPPDAIAAKGCNGSPGLGLNRNVI